jgi:uncharacterized FlaG/YvyC family protein
MLTTIEENTEIMSLMIKNSENNWVVTVTKDKFYTCDEVIDAYIQGKKEGLEQIQKVALEKMIENIKKSGEFTTELLNFFHKEKFNPVSAYLKIISWNLYNVLITIPEEEYLSDRFLSIYEYISQFEEKNKNDFYKLEITITDTNNLNNKNIISDGYIFKHKMSIN